MTMLAAPRRDLLAEDRATSVAVVAADGTPAPPLPIASGSGRIAILVSLGLHGLLGLWLADLPVVMEVKAGTAVSVIEVEMLDADVAPTADAATAGASVHADDHPEAPMAVPDGPRTIADARATAVPEVPALAPVVVPLPATSDASPTAAAIGDTAPAAPPESISDAPAIAVSKESGTRASIAEAVAAAPSAFPPDKKVSKRPAATGSPPSGLRRVERPDGGERLKAAKRPPSQRIANPNAAAGTKTSGSAGISPAARQGRVSDGLTSYLQTIRSRITRQRPRNLGYAHGLVEVRFEIAADGRLRGLSIGKSPDEALDEEALRIVRRASPVDPIPSSLGLTVLPMTVEIEFR